MKEQTNEQWHKFSDAKVISNTNEILLNILINLKMVGWLSKIAMVKHIIFQPIQLKSL